MGFDLLYTCNVVLDYAIRAGKTVYDLFFTPISELLASLDNPFINFLLSSFEDEEWFIVFEELSIISLAFGSFLVVIIGLLVITFFANMGPLLPVKR